MRIEHLFDTVIDPDALSGADHFLKMIPEMDLEMDQDVEEWVVGERGSGGVILRVDP